MCRVYCEYQFLVLSEETCIVTRLGPWRTSGRFRWSHNSLTIAPLSVYILHARETRPEPAETVEKWPKTPSLRDWLIRDMWPHSAPVQSWSKLEAVVWGWFCRICTTFSGVVGQVVFDNLELSWLWRMGRLSQQNLIVISWPAVSVVGPFSDNDRGSNGDTDLHCVILK